MIPHLRPAFLATAAAVVLLLPTALFAEPGVDKTHRVVVVGDIHGAYDSLVEILEEAEIIDGEGRWAGGNTTLVQLGDFTDRGAGIFPIMDLLMRLQEEAPTAGGRAVVLLGNHEVMNLIRLARDVSPAVMEGLAAAYTPKQYQKQYKKAAGLYMKFLTAAQGDQAALPDDFEVKWRERHPPGVAEYLELMGPDGKYGSWLRTLPAVAQVDDAYFLHAGLHPDMEIIEPDALNAKVRAEVTAFDDLCQTLSDRGLILPTSDYTDVIQTAATLRVTPLPVKDRIREMSEAFIGRMDGWILTDPEGPLWFRGFARWNLEEGAEQVAKLKARLPGVRHYVAAHTPVKDRAIHPRFDGAIFLTDTGMLKEHYKGRASALERIGSNWSAIYDGDRDILFGESLARRWRGANGELLPFRSTDQVIDFLRTAAAHGRREVGQGSSATLQVELEKDGIEAHAAFRTIDLEKDQVRLGSEVVRDFVDSYRFEVAAFELNRLLGLDHIPPVVLREIDGKPGSLQLWVEGAMTEGERHNGHQASSDPSWYRQVQTMRLFDRLIYNFDRNRGNILIGDDWKLWMIDHTRSFRLAADVPDLDTVTNVERRFWRRLRQLGADALGKLQPHVSSEQLQVLLERRDVLVSRLGELIAERGEDQVLFDLGGAVPAPAAEIVDGIEDFLKDLPNESPMPDELQTAPGEAR